MPYKSTFELYSESILPELQDGPRTCEEMDVPRYAAQHAKVRGVIACRQDADALRQWPSARCHRRVHAAGARPSEAMHCALMDFFVMGLRLVELGSPGGDFVYENFIECRSPLRRSNARLVSHLQHPASVGFQK